MYPTEYYRVVRRDPNIVCYWRLNDLSGTSAVDRAGKYNLNGIYNGSPINGPSLIYPTENEIESFYPGSKEFGGATQNVEIPNAVPLQIISNLTLEAWIISYVNSSLQNYIIAKKNSSQSAPYSLTLANGKPSFSLGNGTTSKTVTSSISIKTGIPYHLLATYSGKNLIIYINGTEVVNESLGAQELKDTANPVYIGEKSNGSERFDGLIGEVAIYNTGFNIRKAKEHFNIGRQILFKQPYYTNYNSPSYS